MRIKSLLNPGLGIGVEILYSACIILAAFLICLIISFK